MAGLRRMILLPWAWAICGFLAVALSTMPLEMHKCMSQPTVAACGSSVFVGRQMHWHGPDGDVVGLRTPTED